MFDETKKGISSIATLALTLIEGSNLDQLR